MRKKPFLSLLFPMVFLSVFSISATQDIPLHQIMDFEITLAELSTQVNSPEGVNFDSDKYIVLNGVVSSMDVLDPDPETFFGVLELVQGEWIGLEEVKMYRCYIRLEGGRYAGLFPDRRQREQDPESLEIHEKVLLAGRYIGYIDDETGHRYPVLDGVAIRKLR